MGKVVYHAKPTPPKQRPHTHDLPDLRRNYKDYPEGTVWQCDCGKYFIAHYLKANHRGVGWGEWYNRRPGPFALRKYRRQALRLTEENQ